MLLAVFVTVDWRLTFFQCSTAYLHTLWFYGKRQIVFVVSRPNQRTAKWLALTYPYVSRVAKIRLTSCRFGQPLGDRTPGHWSVRHGCVSLTASHHGDRLITNISTHTHTHITFKCKMRIYNMPIHRSSNSVSLPNTTLSTNSSDNKDTEWENKNPFRERYLVSCFLLFLLKRKVFSAS